MDYNFDMLPLSHIYVATSVSRKKSPLLVFGSVLPDVSWTSESEIGRDQIHYAPNAFYDYITKNFPKLKDLALGVRLHSNVGKGADYYSDDLEIGFAKVEGRKIEPEVANLLGEKKRGRSLGLAHNFIEVSVDILLNKDKPGILELYRESMEAIDLDEIDTCLSEYLKVDKEIIKAEVERLINFGGPVAYRTYKSLVERLLILVKQRKGKDIERVKTEELLQKSINLMKDKWQGYLNNAIRSMQKDFSFD